MESYQQDVQHLGETFNQTQPSNSFWASRLKKGGDFEGFLLGSIQDSPQDTRTDHYIDVDLQDFDNKRYQRSNSIESPLFDFNFQSTRNLKKNGQFLPEESSPENSKQSSAPSFGSFKKINTLNPGGIGPNKALLSVIKESVCEDNPTYLRDNGHLTRVGSEDAKSHNFETLPVEPTTNMVSPFRTVNTITSGTGDNQYPFSMKFLEHVRLNSEVGAAHVGVTAERLQSFNNRERIQSIDCPKPTFIETPLLRERDPFEVGDSSEFGALQSNWKGGEQDSSEGRDRSSREQLPKRLRSIEPRRINTFIADENNWANRIGSRQLAGLTAAATGIAENILNTSVVVGGSKDAVLKALQEVYSQKQQMLSVVDVLNLRIDQLRQSLGQSAEGYSTNEPSSPLSKKGRSRVPSIDLGLQRNSSVAKMKSLKLETSIDRDLLQGANFVPVSPDLKDSFMHDRRPLSAHAASDRVPPDSERTFVSPVVHRSVETQTVVVAKSVSTQTDRPKPIREIAVNRSLAELDNTCMESQVATPQMQTWWINTPTKNRFSILPSKMSTLTSERRPAHSSRYGREGSKPRISTSFSIQKYGSQEEASPPRPRYKISTQRSEDLSHRKQTKSFKFSVPNQSIDPYIRDEKKVVNSKLKLRALVRQSLGTTLVPSVYREGNSLQQIKDTNRQRPGSKDPKRNTGANKPPPVSRRFL